MRLYITEKPSQVKALKSVIKNNAIFEPLAGHIMRTFLPHEYDDTFTSNNWYKNVINNNYPFFPVFKKKVQKDGFYMRDGKKIKTSYKDKFNRIKEAISKVDEIVIASDPDDEGVVLAMEVIEACNATNKIIGMINMSKLDKSSLSKEVSILDKIPYETMNDAGNIRGEFDWLMGMNLSPIATILLGRGKTVNMGGVKLPTIRMVVERDLAFEKFKEIPFWEIKGIGKDIKTGKEFPINISVDGTIKFNDKIKAETAMNSIPSSVTVSEFLEKIKSSAPPMPYSLTDLQAECATRYRFSLEKTLSVAQKLYEKQIQSYPRTEENFYSNGEFLDANKKIAHLKNIPDFKNIKILTPLKKRKIFDDKKLEGKAHTALCPTLEAKSSVSLSEEENKVYMMVSTRYLLQFMEDYKYKTTSIKSKSKNYLITAEDKEKVFLGWKELTGFGIDKNKSDLPILKKGENFNIIHLELKKGSTKPKGRFTDASLVKGMEKIATIYDDPEVKKHLGESGIGTPATRAAIIKELYNTKGPKGRVVEPYFIKDKGKVVSTQRARDLISILPEEITNPKLRAGLQEITKDIVKGKRTKKEAQNIIKDNILNMVNLIKQVQKNEGIKIHNRADVENNKPGDKQIAFAKFIEKEVNVKLSEKDLKSVKSISDWINENKDKLPPREYKLSVKQKKIIEDNGTTAIIKLINNTDEKSYKKCSKWISDYFKKNKRKKKS
jgi:DNA topoisomerase-3